MNNRVLNILQHASNRARARGYRIVSDAFVRVYDAECPDIDGMCPLTAAYLLTHNLSDLEALNPGDGGHIPQTAVLLGVSKPYATGLWQGYDAAANRLTPIPLSSFDVEEKGLGYQDGYELYKRLK